MLVVVLEEAVLPYGRVVAWKLTRGLHEKKIEMKKLLDGLHLRSFLFSNA